MLNSAYALCRICLGLASAFVLAALPLRDVAAQAFPSRPITIIFPFPASAGAADVAWREISAQVSKVIGQTVVYENRGGARSRLGLMAMGKAPPDGYLLPIVLDSLVVTQPILDPEFRIEPGKDYAPVAFGYEFPFALVANAELPFRDLKGLIAYAKANPGKINAAVSQAGTTLFASERFRTAAGIVVTNITYRGGDLMPDIVAGRTHITFISATGAPFVSSGKLTAIATTGNKRWKVFPDVPTLAEAGFDAQTIVWLGVVAHPGTPADVITKLNSAFNSALQNPQLAKRLDDLGFATGRMKTPSEFGQFIKSEITAWEPIVRNSGVKME